MKKKLKYIILIVCSGVMLSTTSCKDWLEIYPENTQPSITFWQTKEEVESVITSGYYYLRGMVESYLIPWGELRAGCVYSLKGNKIG